MNWDAIGAVGDLVSGAGVIVTLAFLAVQIRQSRDVIADNSSALRAQAKQSSMRLHSDYSEALLLSPELRSAVLASRAKDFEALSEDERALLRIAWIRALLNYNNDHYLHQIGHLSDEEWEDSLTALRAWYVESGSFCTFWANAGRESFGPRFRAFMDAEIERREQRQSRDSLSSSTREGQP